MTAPWTPIQSVLQKNPALITKIQRLFCMGGAFTQGNISSEVIGGLKRPFAEWNIFWDPKAVSGMLKHTAKIRDITFVPAEACEQAKITEDLLAQLEKQSHHSRLSKLAYEIYKIAAAEPILLWNTVTAICLLHTDLYDTRKTKVKVITNMTSKRGSPSRDENQRYRKFL